MFSKIYFARINDFFTVGANYRQTYQMLLKVYPTYSLKRKVVFLLQLMLRPVLHQARDRSVKLEEWIRQRPRYRKNSIFAVLLHKKAQNGRIYIFEFSQVCAPVSFTKMTNQAVSDFRIEKEAETLNGLAGKTVNFRTPRVIDFVHKGTCAELCVEAAAPFFKNHPKSVGIPEEIFVEIAGLGFSDPIAIQPARDTVWFSTTAESIGSESLKKIVEAISPERFFAVCPAHCDLGSENVLSHKSSKGADTEYLILDWEYFTDHAPALTDRVAYWLGQRHRALKRSLPRPNPDAVLVQLLEEFKGRGYDAEEVAVALLYLVHIRNDLSAKVCGVQHDRL